MLESAHDFEGVVPILNDLLEPPSMANIEMSFDYLYQVNVGSIRISDMS